MAWVICDQSYVSTYVIKSFCGVSDSSDMNDKLAWNGLWMQAFSQACDERNLVASPYAYSKSCVVSMSE